MFTYFSYCWRSRDNHGGRQRLTPAMQAGIAKELWTIDWLYDEVTGARKTVQRRARLWYDMRYRNLQTAGSTMYVVNVDHPTGTATIHMTGGCAIQNDQGKRLASHQSEWSYEMTSLAKARDYAKIAGKQSVIVCRTCENNDGFCK